MCRTVLARSFLSRPNETVKQFCKLSSRGRTAVVYGKEDDDTSDWWTYHTAS